MKFTKMDKQTIKPWPFHILNLESDFRYSKIVSPLYKFLSALICDLQSLLYRSDNDGFICWGRIDSRHIRHSLQQTPVNKKLAMKARLHWSFWNIENVKQHPQVIEPCDSRAIKV